MDPITAALAADASAGLTAAPAKQSRTPTGGSRRRSPLGCPRSARCSGPCPQPQSSSILRTHLI